MNTALPLALCLAALAAPSCKQKENLSPELEEVKFVFTQQREKAAEMCPGLLEEMGVDIEEEIQEAMDCIRHYARTGDARYAHPGSRLTLLHIACLTHAANLARTLLEQGADPNALTAEQEAPLAFVLAGSGKEGATPQEWEREALELMELLLKAGANPLQSGIGGRPLTFQALMSGSEDAKLRLLELGCPIQMPTAEGEPPLDLAGFAAARGWNRVLQFLGSHQIPYQVDEALFTLAAESAASDGEESAPGNKLADCVETLLRQGADMGYASPRQEGVPRLSTADLLWQNKALLQQLQARGITPPRIPLQPGQDLLEQICLAYSRLGSMYSPEELRPYVGMFAQILQLPAEEQDDELLPEALHCALQLLQTLAPEQVAAWVSDSSLWQQPRRLADLGLVEILVEVPGLSLPQGRITTLAGQLDTLGAPEQAACLLPLLGRCPGAEPVIAQLMQDSRPAFRLGAMQAELVRQGLPTLTQLPAWLENHSSLPAPMKSDLALLVRRHDLWDGSLSADDLLRLQQLLRQAGANQEAALLEDIARSLDQPEQLDKLMENTPDWTGQVDAAAAKLLLLWQESLLAS